VICTQLCQKSLIVAVVVVIVRFVAIMPLAVLKTRTKLLGRVVVNVLVIVFSLVLCVLVVVFLAVDKGMYLMDFFVYSNY
jgi:hypothetical protein